MNLQTQENDLSIQSENKKSAPEKTCLKENLPIIKAPDLTSCEPPQSANVPETDLAEIGNVQCINPSNSDNVKDLSSITAKNKPKKVNKGQNKIKKEEIFDKTYILDLEGQIKVLKSTLDLYRRSSGDGDSETNNSQSIQTDTGGTKEPYSGCMHRCCDDLKEKIQENRLRSIELQMMQNMHINNMMHIQLVSQMRSNGYGHVTGPAYHTSPMGPPNGPYTQMQSNIYGIPAANPLHPPGYVQTSIPGHQQAHYFGGPQMQTYGTYMGPSYNWHPLYGQQLQPDQMPIRLPAYPMQHAGQQPVPTHQTPAPGIQSTFAPSSSYTHTATNPRLMNKESVNAKTASNNEQLRRLSEPVVRQRDLFLKDTKKPQTVSFSKKEIISQKGTESSNIGSGNRKRHITSTQNCKDNNENSEGKKRCEKLEIGLDNFLRNDSEVQANDKTPSTEPIYINASPQKDSNHRVMERKHEMETVQDKNDDFLEIPPVKHIPPEPLQEIAPQEQRD